MIKLTTKYRMMTSLITSVVALTVGLNNSIAAEFVVQTDLDSGGGVTIAEISPDVYSIDTLRSAVEQANDELSFPGADIIRFDENIVTVNPGSNTTIILSQVGDQFNFQSQSSDSALAINSIITIQGTPASATQLSIQLETSGLRHFQVNSGGKLRLYDLSIYRGKTPLNSSGRGGAVVVDSNGKLEIINCEFGLNEAVNGGALAFQSGSLDSLIQNSQFLFNTASDENPGTFTLGLGGAIFVDTGTNIMVIENSEFTSNNADASGGAVFIDSPFEILSSTFYRNRATRNGGALNADDQSQFIISNAVFYDNLSRLRGGAIYTSSHAVDASQIFNSTLVKNSAGFDLEDSVSQGLATGGGIYSSTVENLVIHNSIVANNEDLGVADDVNAELVQTSSFNLIGVAGSLLGVSHNTNGNLIGTSVQPIDPRLKLNNLLALIGLKSDSLAVNSGSNAQVIVAGLTEDIEGNDRVISTAVDRGAFESDVFFYNGFELDGSN